MFVVKVKRKAKMNESISFNLAMLVVIIIMFSSGIILYLFSTYNSGIGTLSIGIRDSPIPSASHIYLTISSIELQGGGNGTTMYNTSSTQFDLLSLVNVTKMLGAETMQVGNYTMIRFTVVSALATIAGSNVTLNVPSGEVKVPMHFQVKSGETTTIILDMTVDKTNISASHNLRPVVTGQIDGPS